MLKMDFMSLKLYRCLRKLSLTRVAGLGRWKRKTDAEEGTRLEVWAVSVTSSGAAGAVGPGRAGEALWACCCSSETNTVLLGTEFCQ